MIAVWYGLAGLMIIVYVVLARDLCYKQVPCGVQNTASPAIGRRQTYLYAPRLSLLPAAIYTPSLIACLSLAQPQYYPFPVRSRHVRSGIPDLDNWGAYWVNSLKPIRYHLIGRTCCIFQHAHLNNASPQKYLGAFWSYLPFSSASSTDGGSAGG